MKLTKLGIKLCKILGTILVLALPAIYMTYKITSSPQINCEVCIEFRGKSQCRKATGTNRDDCEKTATDNACAFLASGMTDSIRCSSQTPLKVNFLN